MKIINEIIINKINVNNYFVLSPLYSAARSAAGKFWVFDMQNTGGLLENNLKSFFLGQLAG